MSDWSDFDKKLDKNGDKWADFDKKLTGGAQNQEDAQTSSAPSPSNTARSDTPLTSGFFGQNALLGLANLADMFSGTGHTIPVANSIDPTMQTRFGAPANPANTLLQASGIVSPENANPQGETAKLAAAGTRGLTGQLPLAVLSSGGATIPGLIKLGAQGVMGGIGGEVGQQLAPEHPILGGLLGSIIGAGTPNIAEIGAAKLAGVPASLLKLQTPEVNPQAAGPSQDLVKSGIELSINQLLPNAKRSITQQQQINSALAKLFGENATDLKPDTFANAAKRIGASFDDVAAKTPNIPLDAQYSTDLSAIKTRLDNSALSDSEKNALQRMIDNVSPSNNTQPGQILPGISGKQYQQYTQSGGQLSDLLGNDNSTVKGLAQNIRSVLDDAMERAVPSDVADQLRTARTQYKNMLMVKDFKPDDLGNIDPGKITSTRISNYYPNFYKGNAGRQDDLENVLRGASLLKTPENASPGAINSLLKYGLTGAGTLAVEHGIAPNLSITDLPTVAGLLGTGAAAAALPYTSKAILNSSWYKNQLLKQALGQTPTYNPLFSAAGAFGANKQ